MKTSDERLRRLESQVRFLRLFCAAQITLLVMVAAGFLMHPAEAKIDANIIHARGLVIEDAQGRPRMLLGAPFPAAAGRKRQDAGSAALLFLNESGADRLLIGGDIPVQVGGKVLPNHRAVQGEAYGITLMDGQGNERGGFGFTALPSGGGRATLALDRPTGDAWGALVDDNSGFAGMLFNYPMPSGEYQSGIEMGVMRERPFLHFKDKDDNSRAEISVGPDGSPAFTVADHSGKVLGDLFEPLVKK